MNEKKNIFSLNKKLVKQSLLKYSNTAIFERREKNYNSEQNSKRKIKKIFNKTTNNFYKKKIKTKEDFLIPFSKTKSSFYNKKKNYNILPLLNYFEKNIMTKKKAKEQYDNNFICKTDRNIREKGFFITDFSTLTTKNNRKKNKYYFNIKNNKNKKIVSQTDKKENITKDDSIKVLLLIQSSRNQDQTNYNNEKTSIESYLSKGKTYDRNYRNISYAQTEQNKHLLNRTSEKYSANVLEIKLSKYKKHLSVKDYISKLYEQKINSHTTKAKSERLRRMEEVYQSQIEFYKDSIKSFINSKKILENEFNNKVGDYTKYISTKREREKIQQSLLRQEILDHRKEIEQIRAKINKIEIEKKNIIKWIFLQIQMKEKKLKLPEYYKNIISNYGTNKSSKKLVYRNEEKSDSSLSETKKSNKKSIIMLKDYFSIKYFKEKNSINNNISGSSDKKNRADEYRRIINYKNNLIYKTPEEFKDRLISLEKGNLALLQYKDIINVQLFKYKKELESLKKERQQYEKDNQKFEEWNIELNNIKNIADENSKMAIYLKKRKTKKNLNKKTDKDGHSKSNSNINGKISDKYKYKNLSLYKTIYEIFERCQIIGNNLKFSIEILNQVNRKVNTKEKEILLMLEYIEQTTDYLIMSINKKMNQGKEIKDFVKTFRMNIERQHKVEKAKNQMLLDMQKIKFLAEKVNKRYNKLYFLQSRNFDLKDFKIKNEDNIAQKDIKRKHNIEDYLYNDESSKE